jgi:hypothetical protein
MDRCDDEKYKVNENSCEFLIIIHHMVVYQYYNICI